MTMSNAFFKLQYVTKTAFAKFRIKMGSSKLIMLDIDISCILVLWN